MFNAKIKYKELKNLISQTFDKVYKIQTGTKINTKLIDETLLLDSGLDCLDFAVLVTQLEKHMLPRRIKISNVEIGYMFKRV